MPEGFVEAVRIRYNGLTSFVPPTFCFELYGGNDDIVDTVSELVIVAGEYEGLKDFEVLALLDRGGLRARGTIREYATESPTGVNGKQFAIDQCVPE